MKKVELLCPAGNYAAFEAALYNGADAIFLAGPLYGARASADNFTLEEIRKACELAHLYDVKIHVTVNTLIHDDELPACMDYISSLNDIGVDALIIQDLGLMDLVRHRFPNLEIHASTQMHIHNLSGVLKCKEWDLERCVVARESSLDLIQKMGEQGIEIETFVQGAYCVSYSGECHMSRSIGGRSANRGECAQSCRLPYTLVVQKNDHEEIVETEGKYLLSLKDLNAIRLIPELIQAGVSSFKIEGRMKRPEYVACMCRIYRQAIDAYYDKKDFSVDEVIYQEMKKVFNRGFTEGYLLKKQGKEITSCLRPNHQGVPIGKVVGFHHDKMVIELTGELSQHDGIRILNAKEDQGFIVNYLYKDGKLVSNAENCRVELMKMPVSVGDLVMKTSDVHQLKELSNLPERKIPVHLHAVLRYDAPLQLTVSDMEHEVSAKSSELVEKAKTMPLSSERIEKQLRKLGNTPFVCTSCKIEMDENISFSISTLNQLRREAMEKLIEIRKHPARIQKESQKLYSSNCDLTHRLSVNIQNEKQYEIVKDYPVDIYVGNSSLYEKIKKDHVYLNYPRVTQKNYHEQGLIHDVGGIQKGMHASAYMNCMNAYSANLLFREGISCIELSYECSDEDLEKLCENYKKLSGHDGNFEVEVYGRVENMVLENCLIMSQLNKKKHCQECHQKEYYLKDAKQHAYRLLGDEDCHLVVYHSEPFNKISKMKDYQKMGISNFRISLTFEDESSIRKVIEEALQWM